jgi:hypothetical protein
MTLCLWFLGKVSQMVASKPLVSKSCVETSVNGSMSDALTGISVAQSVGKSTKRSSTGGIATTKSLEGIQQPRAA